MAFQKQYHTSNQYCLFPIDIPTPIWHIFVNTTFSQSTYRPQSGTSSKPLSHFDSINHKNTTLLLKVTKRKLLQYSQLVNPAFFRLYNPTEGPGPLATQHFLLLIAALLLNCSSSSLGRIFVSPSAISSFPGLWFNSMLSSSSLSLIQDASPA